MDAESWFNAKKAVELGFADEVLFDKGKEENSEEKEEENQKEDVSPGMAGIHPLCLSSHRTE